MIALVGHLDDAIRAGTMARPSHIGLAGKAWGRAFKLRREMSEGVRAAMPIVMRALSVRTLEASTYSLTGLRFIASEIVDKYDSLTRAAVDDLRDHADLCGLGFTLGWVDDPLPQYDEGTTPEYVEESRKRQLEEAQAFWQEKERDRKRARENDD